MISIASTNNAMELFKLESSIFSKEQFQISLASFYYHLKKSIIFTYTIDYKIVAYILWLKRKNYYRLYSICVDKNYRSKHISSKLLSYSFNVLKDKKFYSLEVSMLNKNAIRIYKNNGFVVKKQIKNYYVDSDAIIMIKET